MATNRTPTSISFDDDLEQRVDQYVESHGIKKCELFEKAVKEWLGGGRDDRLESKLNTLDAKIDQIRDHVGTAGDPPTDSNGAITPESNNNLSAQNLDSEGDGSAAPDNAASVSTDSPDHTAGVRASEGADDATDAQTDGGTQADAHADTDSDSDDRPSRSLAECATEGPAFTWEELKEVKDYAKTDPERFELHPSRVDPDRIKRKPETVVGVTYGVLSYEQKGWFSGEEVAQERLAEIAPDGLSDRTLFDKRSSSHPSYWERLKEHLVAFPRAGASVYACSRQPLEQKIEQVGQSATGVEEEMKEELSLLGETENEQETMVEWATSGRKNLDVLLHAREQLDDVPESITERIDGYIEYLQTEFDKMERHMAAERAEIPESDRFEWEEKPRQVTEMERKRWKSNKSLPTAGI
jgi:hypothetical protein